MVETFAIFSGISIHRSNRLIPKEFFSGTPFSW